MLAIKAAILLNCKISEKVIFDRKHYLYRDLPHSYQITQKNHPIGRDGFLAVAEKNFKIDKIQLEMVFSLFILIFRTLQNRSEKLQILSQELWISIVPEWHCLK